MRASPPVQLLVQRFGWWQAAVAMLAALAMATMTGWLRAQPDALPMPSMLAWSFSALIVACLALAATRVRSASLRWDGERWWLAPLANRHDEQSGHIEVALDLGAWMLLRFQPSSAIAGRRPVRWLPLQRNGLEAHWHALRCAVYFPGPGPAREAAGPP